MSKDDKAFDPTIMPSARAARRRMRKGNWGGPVYGAIVGVIGLLILGAIALALGQR
jgi:hypothetical protein